MREVLQKISALRFARTDVEEVDFDGLADDQTLTGESFQAIAVSISDEIIERELMAEAIAGRIKELQERKSRIEKSADQLRTMLLQAMDIRGERKIQAATVTLSVSDLKPDIFITDESRIPSVYFEPQPPRLDKKALKDAVLKDGEVIDGVELGNGKISLTIRRK